MTCPTNAVFDTLYRASLNFRFQKVRGVDLCIVDQICLYPIIGSGFCALSLSVRHYIVSFFFLGGGGYAHLIGR